MTFLTNALARIAAVVPIGPRARNGRAAWTIESEEVVNALKLAQRSGLTSTAMRLSLHYNANCPDCVRQAKRTARLDWLRVIDLRTDVSPVGAVPVGKIVVVDERNRRVFTGVYATRAVCLRLPAFFLYGLLLYLPPIRNLIGRSQPGCNGDTCEV